MLPDILLVLHLLLNSLSHPDQKSPTALMVGNKLAYQYGSWRLYWTEIWITWRPRQRLKLSTNHYLHLCYQLI